ncbi:DNA-directed RNA polymerase sigma-70 factor [Clostridium gelidum]|uniref:DNA-directed RNA polymerase sigma-70 factor n=1 Tax=Clostridium gelidum TaxID=704125 RepID=A0ABN6IUJ6_9CLOT|nr:sigma-70 family RNA polymerase sigma factor [Clostridium gelidum]BCZ45862.1 DNA-directed RNA polymerase sigma-70 factor [Clostridium gelidum]
MLTNLLLSNITTFHNNQEVFGDILTHFSSKIKYLTYKLKYPEAETDLTIYLYELLKVIDEQKFNTDKDILMYINICLNNKSISLFHKISKDKESLSFTSDTEILDIIDCNEKNDEYSDIIFNDLISSLNPRQKEIIFYKFYLQLSDIEIAKLFKISRQAVNKSQRAALKILRENLLN